MPKPLFQDGAHLLRAVGFVQIDGGSVHPYAEDDVVHFEHNDVVVRCIPVGFEVFAPGDGSLMACFPDAELVLRFVQAFEREADLMTADGFNDEQFERVQLLADKLVM